MSQPVPFDARALLTPGRRAPAPASKVDCDGCTICCRKELVLLTANDDPMAFTTVEVINPLNGQTAHAIPLKADGACHYLGDQGCTIYERRPEICRAFSCVGWVLSIEARTTRAERRRDLKRGLIDRETWEAGKSRSEGFPTPHRADADGGRR